MPFWPLFRKRDYFVWNVLPRLPGLECLCGKIFIPVPEISVTGPVLLLRWAVGKVIRKKELRGEISKTEPTRLTGLAPWDWIVREFRGNRRGSHRQPTGSTGCTLWQQCIRGCTGEREQMPREMRKHATWKNPPWNGQVNAREPTLEIHWKNWLKYPAWAQRGRRGKIGGTPAVEPTMEKQGG